MDVDDDSSSSSSYDESRPLMADTERDHDANAGFEAARRRNNADAGHPDAPLDGVDPLQIDDGDKVPSPVRRVLKAVAVWSKGPPTPRLYRIRPFLPAIQEYPLVIVDRLLPKKKHRTWLAMGYLAAYFLTFVLVVRQSTLAVEIEGWGQPQKIGCGMTYWGAGNSCGVDGNECRPFSDGGFPFQCNANCQSYHLLNPRAVGDQEAIYRPLVVGGPTDDAHPQEGVYRGDSFVCGAAIHAGVVSNAAGGCGVVRLVGQQHGYTSTTKNGISSLAFDTYFPSSFQFVPDVECSASDNRWSVLAVSAVFTGVLSLFTSSTALFFFANFVGIFWTVGMALDPPPSSTVTSLFSIMLGKFLPAMFCAWVMYDKMGVRRTLRGLRAQVEKSILWLGPCWVGALDNYTLSFIPIQRLTGHDLQQQPGAKAALSIIVILLVVIIATQVWFFQQEGRFLKYIKLYGLFITTIVIGLLLPGLNLRIHHYILALVLLPGTSIQTRPSLLYQGLLVGLFINGIARWGFDPVLETSAALRGDAQKGTILPTIHSPVIALGNGSDTISTITFTWDNPTQQRFDGISILVNDVERFRSYFDDDVVGKDAFLWSRNKTLDLPEYFRFGFMDGSLSGDYSKAGTWTADGEWVEMKPGPSRVKMRSIDQEERLRRH